jgi:hypothetical protein
MSCQLGLLSFQNRAILVDGCWIVKRCPFELNFGKQLEDPWIYMPTKKLCILEQQFV